MIGLILWSHNESPGINYENNCVALLYNIAWNIIV